MSFLFLFDRNSKDPYNWYKCVKKNPKYSNTYQCEETDYYTSYFGQENTVLIPVSKLAPKFIHPSIVLFKLKKYNPIRVVVYFKEN